MLTDKMIGIVLLVIIFLLSVCGLFFREKNEPFIYYVFSGVLSIFCLVMLMEI